MDWQEYSIWGITALTLGIFIKKIITAAKKRSRGCGNACSCPSKKQHPGL